MNIGVIIATSEELAQFLKNGFELIERKTKPFEHLVYGYKDHKIIAIFSGIGEISSSAATQFLLDHFSIDLLINYGVAGSLKPHLEVMNVCLVKEIIDGDFDTSQIDNCGPSTHLELAFNKPQMPVKNKYYELAKNNFKDLKVVSCYSSSKFIDGKDEKDRIVKNYQCEICEMEAAGIYITALRNKVPTIFLKAISDGSDEGAQDYETFASLAASKAFKILEDLINLL